MADGDLYAIGIQWSLCRCRKITTPRSDVISMAHKKEVTSTELNQSVILTGDRSKLKDLLCNRLDECGWRDEVRLMCRNVIKEKGNNMRAEQLIAEVTPKARALVPDAVKKELLIKIKAILATQENIDV